MWSGMGVVGWEEWDLVIGLDGDGGIGNWKPLQFTVENKQEDKMR